MVLTIPRAIITFASFMGTTWCYTITMAILAGCTIAVADLGQSSPTAVGIIYGLSAFSIVQASTILVAQRHAEHTASKREEALQAKLNELIRVTKDARNELIGIENEIEDDMEA